MRCVPDGFTTLLFLGALIRMVDPPRWEAVSVGGGSIPGR